MEVQDGSYSHYTTARNAGCVIAEERHGKWLYYAVKGKFYAPTAGGGEVVYVTTERYRTEPTGK